MGFFFHPFKSPSSFESNTFISSISGQTYTNMLPLLCVPNLKLVPSGNRRRHTGTAALPGSGGMQSCRLSRSSAVQAGSSTSQPSAPRSCALYCALPRPWRWRYSLPCPGKEAAVREAGAKQRCHTRASSDSGPRARDLPRRGYRGAQPAQRLLRAGSAFPDLGLIPAGPAFPAPGLIPVGPASLAPGLIPADLASRTPWSSSRRVPPVSLPGAQT